MSQASKPPEVDAVEAHAAEGSGRHAQARRSAVIATGGMAATSQPLATLVAIDVLRSGGNAADAAVAANAMQGLVEPMSCGIGGDLFVLYWEAKTGKLHGLNASGRSPFAASLDDFRRRGLEEIPEAGPLSWSVPGCVRGWEDLLKRVGTRSLDELLAPAICYAEQGFPVSPVIANYWRRGAEALAKHRDAAATYLPHGRAPAAGEVFRNPRLAATYRLIGAEGADAFYRGPVAETITSFSRAEGGLFSMRDFAEHRSDWVEPVSTSYRGYDVWELPPNGQGIAVLQMLNVLEQVDLRSAGPASAEYWHWFIEAKKLAYADRARHYADPSRVNVPVAELISKDYAARRAELIDPKRAMADAPPGELRSGRGDTIYLSVVDAQRNCCSLIQSNFNGFGSQLAPSGLGFVLQNRGSLFALDERHPNCLAPNKRPFHTIIPALVTRGGRPWFCFGVMGGDMQPQGQVQVLVNLIDFGLDPQAAGDAPRLRHSGSATPTGQIADQHGGLIEVEPEFAEATVAELDRRGHRVQRVRDGGYGGYQGILIDHEHGVLWGASESRKDGCALGY